MLHWQCMFAQIPSDHLEGLYVWNSEEPQPVRRVFAAGSGLLNTDYVLYVQSTYTTTCLTGVSIGICAESGVIRKLHSSLLNVADSGVWATLKSVFFNMQSVENKARKKIVVEN